MLNIIFKVIAGQLFGFLVNFTTVKQKLKAFSQTFNSSSTYFEYLLISIILFMLIFLLSYLMFNFRTGNFLHKSSDD